MEHAAAATVPVKLTLSGSKRRSRLNVPLKFVELCQKVRSTFPDVKNFELQYVDDEGDNIIVSSDADLQEAQSVFRDLGRVPSFLVNKTAAATPAAARPPARTNTNHRRCGFTDRRFGCGRRPMVQVLRFPGVQEGLKSLFGGRALHFGITCDGSNQHPLVGKRFHKIGHDYDLNETEFAKLTRQEQEKYEIIAFPGAAPVPVKSIPVPVKTPDSEACKSNPAIHYGVRCDGSNQNPLVGVRYHKIGCNYDLNKTEFAKLPLTEQHKYEMITRPGATPVPVARLLDCTFVRDVTIPDGQVLPPSKNFKKTWLVKTGINGWPAGCALVNIGGDKMNAPQRVMLEPQKPHTLVPVSIDFTAPSCPAKITSKWQVAGPDGKLFGHTLWASVDVKTSKVKKNAVASAVTPEPRHVETEHASAGAAAAAH